MDFELSPEEQAFRDEVRTWLKANTARDADGDGAGDMKSFIESRRAWQKKLYDAGYVGITWPKEYGGRAGSDLSGLQTRAEDTGDHYVVNGQKVWTTLAHAAKWCMLLARERKETNPRDGLTYLLVDMESPGIEVRPLVQITGDAEFNEIFFKDVEVPKSQVLGEPGQGWAVAMTTLLHERGTLGLALTTRAQITASELAERTRKLGRGNDPLVRQRIAQHTIEARALQLNGYRAVTAVKRSGIPGPEGSILKLMWSELNQRMAETAMDIAGPASQVGDGDGWKYQFLRSRANTIEAGTSEVFRSILAQRVLGLPRSR